ncbi:NACHT domain-containing protein [Streptomyces sp. NRRL B-1347]|uniref:NACHT domain-containing protein n=1 Tax=Streptomyces sp. NRRL B-1347 TaxID=1476877 RepID=UPI0004CA5ADF|nr:NACHT domain-containing protein [Streptomyces sp. NRRL B-1347]
METGRPGPAGLRRLLGGGVVVLLASGVWAGLSVARGGLQPQDVSGVLGLPLGVLGVLVGAAVSLSALRLQQATDARAAALDSLAGAVAEIEVAERAHMLGDGAHLIDLRVEVTPRQGGAEPAGPQRLSDVAARYCSAPGRLVVTGAPGAGKTVFAVHLVVLLLAARGPADAVPVRLAIGDLPPPRTERRWWHRWRPGGFERWLTDSLVKVYGLRERTAADLVTRRLVIPVLDGLDEMDADVDGESASRAQQALDELNAYESVAGSAPVVLTCREQRYAELSDRYAWLRRSALLRIAGVDVSEARSYVRSRSDGRASPMDALLDDMGPAVAEALSSPFYLGLAYAVYGEVGQARSLARLRTADEVREHLLAHYIPAATRAANAAVRQARRRVAGVRSAWAGRGEYEPATVHRWLHHLAGEEGRIASLGEALGLVRARVLAGVVVFAVCGAALVWGPEAVRGLFPEPWWDHRHGAVLSFAVAGAGAVFCGAVFVSLLVDAIYPEPAEGVRGARAGAGRLRKSVADLAYVAMGAGGLPALFVIGAAAGRDHWLAGASAPIWYAVGAVVCFAACVGAGASERLVAHEGCGGLVGCVVLPALGWATGLVVRETDAYALWFLACLVFVVVAILLVEEAGASGFSVVAAVVAAVMAWSSVTVAPGGGFWSGAALGAAVFYVLACLFLGMGRAARIWREARRARRAVRLPGGLKLTVIPFVAGAAAEGLLGFAGVVTVTLAWMASCAAALLALYAMWLCAACLGRIPPRTDAFTTWAYHAGLLRIVGGGYQFRHGELHAWLVRNPRAPRP